MGYTEANIRTPFPSLGAQGRKGRFRSDHIGPASPSGVVSRYPLSRPGRYSLSQAASRGDCGSPDLFLRFFRLLDVTGGVTENATKGISGAEMTLTRRYSHSRYRLLVPGLAFKTRSKSRSACLQCAFCARSSCSLSCIVRS